MRPVREITAEEENFRLEQIPNSCLKVIRRDGVKPEPEGTIILTAFRVVGYDKDCDGSLMARLEQIDNSGQITGWMVNQIGLWPNADLVVSLEEWKKLFIS